jgi:hypothetical protein
MKLRKKEADMEGVDVLNISSFIVEHPDNANVALYNFDFDMFIDLFKKVEIDISQYWLVNYGTNAAGERRLVYLIIRGYAIRPFFGPHLISVQTLETGQTEPTMTTVWVHSLTFLRRCLFLFQDRLSFERSTFLCPLIEGNVLIRLKSIRGFIHIPKLALTAETKEECVVVPRKLRDRVKINALLNKNIQQLIMFVCREVGLNMRDSILEMGVYTQAYCNELLIKFAS